MDNEVVDFRRGEANVMVAVWLEVGYSIWSRAAGLILSRVPPMSFGAMHIGHD